MEYPYGYVTEIYGYDYACHDDVGYSITTRKVRLSGPIHDTSSQLPDLDALDVGELLASLASLTD